ncbi:MAG: nuclear transport factor 2 family protein [Saprospiraceae bacterium]|nr:nuclear transport factor 2 family protein [Saprospiraceae bacterium]
MLCLILIQTFFFGQLQSADKTQILALMDKYDKAIINMDTDGILSLYEVDGIFGDVKGHDAIRKYLSGFSKTKVTRYVSTTDKVVVTSGLATHTGTFIQEVISNGSRKVYNGAFRIIWSKSGGSWKIKFMTTELDYSR